MTTATEHTPGPWTIEEGNCNGSEHGHWGTVSGGEDDLNLATIWADVPEIAKSALANARLIAAAPELLHALRKFVEWQDEMKNAVPRIYIDRAKEAIAKAEGRS